MVRGLRMHDETNLLKASEVIHTVKSLQLRILDRFPDSGLGRICRMLLDVAGATDTQIEWIERPRWRYRILVGLFLLVAVAGLVYVVGNVEVAAGGFSLADFVQVCEAGLNNLVLIGAAIVFLISIEARAKRKRVVRCVNRLRSIAHLIEAHQLTKDPTVASGGSDDTQHSPKRDLKPYELGRYLNYCSEMLSLVGKVGFLYVQKFHDPVAVESVNDLEILTTGLSRKIWQKIMILRSQNAF